MLRKITLKQISLLFIIITITGFFVFLTAFCSVSNNNIHSVSRQGFLMDTVMQISINTNFTPEKDNEILNGAFAILTSIDSLLSIYNPESELSKINAKSGRESLKAHEITFNAIFQAKKAHELTGGIFNPLIGAVTKLWKINRADNKIPTKTELDNAIKLSDIENLELSNENNEIFLKSEGSVIDLGGIAKGFASQKIAEYLLENKINSALINLGGNVYVIGKNQHNKNWNKDWKIGIQNPLSPRGNAAIVLSVRDCAVVTSGNYERYKTINGKKYSHFFNPLTGESVNSNLLSVTVISPDGSLADALATAFMISGYESSVEILRKIKPVPYALFIQNTKDGLMIFADKNLKGKIISSEFPVIYY